MPDTATSRRLSLIATGALLIAVGTVSFLRAARGEWDFSHFYHDARDVWEHGGLNAFIDRTGGDAGRRLPFYLPAVPAILAPLTAFGLTPAAALWAALQVASLAYCLFALRHCWAGSSAAFWLAICLALPALYEAAKFNQLTYPVLALIIAAFEAFERRRIVAGALALGLAIVLKLLPAVFVLWLCVKRRWGAVALTVVAAAVLASGPALIAYGPRKAVEHYAEWCAFNFGGDSVRGLLAVERREHFVDHRNQSITQVLARWTWAAHPYRMPWQPVSLAAPTVVMIASGLAAFLLVALLWRTRQAAHLLGVAQRRAEWAAYAIAMLVLSPLVRQYYLAWVLPALVLLASRAVGDCGRRSGIGLAVWTLGMLAWMWPMQAWGEAARLGGLHLAMLLAIGGIVLAGPERGRAAGSE